MLVRRTAFRNLWPATREKFGSPSTLLNLAEFIQQRSRTNEMSMTATNDLIRNTVHFNALNKWPPSLYFLHWGTVYSEYRDKSARGKQLYPNQLEDK
jgi:hypothetical protein